MSQDGLKGVSSFFHSNNPSGVIVVWVDRRGRVQSSQAAPGRRTSQGAGEGAGGAAKVRASVPWERHSAHCEQRVLVTGGSQALLHSLGCLCPELQGLLPKPVATNTSKTNVLYDREDAGLYLGKPRISHLCGLAWGKSNGETECKASVS